jgi:Domain of unknown function (DUF5615)
MDVHIPAGIPSILRARGVDLLTAQEDGADELVDDLLLDRSSELERALFTYDQGFTRLVAARQRMAAPFYCVFVARDDPSQVRLYAEWLEMYASLADSDHVRGRLIFIP